MKLKKIISIALVSVMTMSMFAGCSGKDADKDVSVDSATTAAQTTAASTEAPTEATPEEVTLTMWVTEGSQGEFNLAQEQRFAEKYPYIKLNKVMTTESMDYM
ncbi:MAG: hypothetical protein K0R92_2574, partial [Lachnospiraceae bacterium]|nr:hypothetical protein [Lachnospiraceae bacterium]